MDHASGRAKDQPGVIGFIPAPEQPANLCFGGPNHDTLYLTARTGFYMIPTKVKGANPAK